MLDKSILYLNCDEKIVNEARVRSSLQRLVNNRKFKKILIISSQENGSVNSVTYLNNIVDIRLFEDPGVTGDRTVGSEFSGFAIAEILKEFVFRDNEKNIFELKIKPGMTDDVYDKVIEHIDSLGVGGGLVVCVDRISSAYKKRVGWGLGEREEYCRNCMKLWESEKLWNSTFGKSNIGGSKNNKFKNSMPSLHILRIAFGLGGYVTPSKIFGLFDTPSNNSFHGYYWK